MSNLTADESIWQMIKLAIHTKNMPLIESWLNQQLQGVDALFEEPLFNTSITPLMYASAIGNLDVVRYLVEERYASVNLYDEYGNTALLYTIFDISNIPGIPEFNSVNIRTDIALYLLEHGASHTIRTDIGKTPLIWFSGYGDSTVVEALLRKGASANEQIESGHTALIYACKYGKLENIRILLKYGANIDYQLSNGRTALMYAVVYDHKYIVDLLLKQKANCDIQDNTGMTALMLACTEYRVDIVDKIVDAGAKLDVYNHSGYRALSIIFTSKDEDLDANIILDKIEDIIDILCYGGSVLGIEGEHSLPLIEIIARKNEGESIRLLHFILKAYGFRKYRPKSVQIGGSYNPIMINLKNEDGRTPLMIAAAKGSVNIVKLLLQYGADVHILNNNNETPQMIARRIKGNITNNEEKLVSYTEIIRLLNIPYELIPEVGGRRKTRVFRKQSNARMHSRRRRR